MPHCNDERNVSRSKFICVRDLFKSKTSSRAFDIRMVTTGGAEGETERKPKFVARIEGENQREREGRRKERTRDRMSFRGRLISLSTRLPVSLCLRLFVSLYFAQLPVSENSKASLCHRSLALSPVIYIRDPLKFFKGLTELIDITSTTTINRVKYFSFGKKESKE